MCVHLSLSSRAFRLFRACPVFSLFRWLTTFLPRIFRSDFQACRHFPEGHLNRVGTLEVYVFIFSKSRFLNENAFRFVPPFSYHKHCPLLNVLLVCFYSETEMKRNALGFYRVANSETAAPQYFTRYACAADRLIYY